MNRTLLTLALFALVACGGTSSSGDGGTDGGGGKINTDSGATGGGTGGGMGGGTSGVDSGMGGGTGSGDSGTGSGDSGTGSGDSGTGGDAGTGTQELDSGMAVDAGGGDAGLPSAVAIAIASGRQHSCAVVTGGKIRCWGSNFFGQLGTGTTGDNDVANSPVEVSDITAASSISSFKDHTCAVISGGVKCWGANEAGQLGDESTNDTGTPVNVTGLTSGVTKVVVGNQHSCALTTGGGVKCWGHNSGGELGNGDDNYNPSAVPVNVTGLTSGVTSISAGVNGTCAITTAGAVKCWGTNGADQLGDASGTPSSNVPVDVATLASGVSFIASGAEHNCAAVSSGVECWGSNDSGEIGTGTKSTKVSAPTAALNFTAAAKAIAAGFAYTCAITSTNGVKCWGDKLGASPRASSATPTDVSGLSGIGSSVSAIAGGTQHVCALLSTGAVKCWGFTDGNALGDGTGNDSVTPVNVLTLP